jgi:hypothetical protein
MKNPKLDLFRGMNGKMFGAIIGTVVACVYGAAMLESKRVLPNDYDVLDADIQRSQALIKEYVSAPVLPPLKESWREVAAIMQMNGLVLTPDDGAMKSGTISYYDGPLKYWGGSVSGDAKTVIAAIRSAQMSLPTFLLDYSAGEGQFKIYLAVVGI